MHDYFEILGVARNARPTDIRQACCRHVRASHPDVWDGDAPQRSGRPTPGPADPLTLSDLTDAAIDFVDASSLVDRMHAAFFNSPARQQT